MMNKKYRIDRLLDKNAAKQLERVDWDRLTDEISDRLERARQTKVPPRIPSVVRLSPWPSFFKITAGIITVAAVILVAVIFRLNESSKTQMTGDRTAEVIDTKRATSIQVKDTAGEAFVVVHVGSTGKEAAKCIVDIIDHNGDLEEGNQAAWIIINATRRALADNGYNREEDDLMCLL